MSEGETHVHVERRGQAGILTLDRPKALNALDLPMVQALRAALEAFAGDPAIATVVLRASTPRAFCAGGDIRAMHDLGKAGHLSEALAFWREEYLLNREIGRYRKPFVSLIEGIVMGGGVGLTVHGRHRVISETITLAMPEVGIGFFPDVGTTYALPRLAGHIGTFMAVTGARLGAGDALSCGFATAHVPSAGFVPLIERLASGEEADHAIAAESAPLAPGPVTGLAQAIDRLFTGSSIEEILAALDAAAAGEGPEAAFAAEQAAIMRKRSPTSMRLALKQMRLGKNLDLATALSTEFRIVSRIVEAHDFYEGVRAVIIDKDQNPQWSPSRLEDVSDAMIDAYFAPLPAGELPAT